MKKAINKILVSLWLFIPCALMAQGTAPSWLDADVRSAQYPQSEYYTGYSEIALAAKEQQQTALNRAKQIAVGELSQRIRVLVNTDKTSIDKSVSGSDIEEQLHSSFTSYINTVSLAEVVGSSVESYYDASRRTAYAFAHVSRSELSVYYQKQISLWLGEVEGTLKTAGELAEKGYKMKAKKECSGVIDLFARIVFAQDLLTAIDPTADLQQSRTQQLKNTLIQTITDLENSIYVYVECTESVNGQTVVHIGDRLPGLITEKGCGCNFTDSQEEADYVIQVNARLARCQDAPDNIVFCYATATASVYNAHTQKTLKPQITESKGGWTVGNRTKATEEAFDDLADKIVEKVVQLIKN
ncbi:MAG: hypothetical protein LBM68_01515 [Bacteroidales bacterium]|jgi:hypothetical protein|nr:hypothetical protein [Bacteroidales bacterium]